MSGDDGGGAMADRTASWLTSRIGAVLVLVATALLAGLAFAFSPAQPAAEATDGLPAGAQSTRVTEVADRSAIDALGSRLAATTGGAPAAPAIVSEDGQAVLLIVTLPEGLDGSGRNAVIEQMRAELRGAGLAAGVTAQVTGGAAFSRDIAAAFDGADVTLLATTAAVVAVL